MAGINRLNLIDKFKPSEEFKGIYIIKNKVNGKRYIGSSTVSVYKRLNHHRWKLRKNKHSNKRMQNDYNKHGEECFVVYFFSSDNVLDREYEIMNNYSFHYNLCRDKSAIAYHKGLKRRKETCEAISKALTGRKLSLEHIESLKGKRIHTTGKNHWRVKPFYQYDKQGNFIKLWENGISHCAKELNILRTSIDNCIAGRSKSAGGYIFKYTM